MLRDRFVTYFKGYPHRAQANQPRALKNKIKNENDLANKSKSTLKVFK